MSEDKAVSHPPLPQQRWPILTQQARIPWAWVLWIQIPWFGIVVVDNISGTIMTFTLRQFVSSAWIITLVTSSNTLFNMLVGATCNYTSDRIWTRWGRRRPFLITGHLVIFAALVLIPFIREFWLLVVVLVLYEMLRDMNSPLEPLEKEIIPTSQRGRGQAISQVARVGGALFFSAFMLAQFDNRYTLLDGLQLTGEQVAYWSAATIALGVAFFYWRCVRELPPAAKAIPRAKKFATLSEFIRNVFCKRHNLVLFLVAVAVSVFWSSLGNLTPLLITEQFGYSKNTLAWINSTGQVFTILVMLPLGGWIVDKADRLKLFQICAVGMTLHHIGFYVYARYLAPHGIPPVGALIGFAMFHNAVGGVGSIASAVILFDYIETSQLGTVSAGIGMTRTIYAIVTHNVIGIYVTFYSRHFIPDGKNDYLCGYHFLILFSLAAAAIAFWFGQLVKSGKLVPYGLIEQQERIARMKMVHHGSAESEELDETHRTHQIMT